MRVVIVGAGLTGLVAAAELRAGGADVLVIDKGRSPGGRLATRRIAGARLDHGAQFFTVRTPAFAARVEGWLDRGLVRVWAHGFGDADGHPRYVATDGMNSLAKDLADGLEVECSTMAFAVRENGRIARPPASREPSTAEHDGAASPRWRVVIDDATTRSADAVVLTCPLPQAFALLVDAGLDLEDGPFRTDYDRTIGLLTVLDGPGGVPAPGGVQRGDPTFGFIADNLAKGISDVPAVTFHATPEWSDAHWDDDAGTLVALLEDAAAPWLGGSRIVERQLKKWRFATPRTIWPDPCWQGADGTIVLAGDAFAGPRIEGAHNSGLAAAHALVR